MKILGFLGTPCGGPCGAPCGTLVAIALGPPAADGPADRPADQPPVRPPPEADRRRHSRSIPDRTKLAHFDRFTSTLRTQTKFHRPLKNIFFYLFVLG